MSNKSIAWIIYLVEKKKWFSKSPHYSSWFYQCSPLNGVNLCSLPHHFILDSSGLSQRFFGIVPTIRYQTTWLLSLCSTIFSARWKCRDIYQAFSFRSLLKQWNQLHYFLLVYSYPRRSSLLYKVVRLNLRFPDYSIFNHPLGYVLIALCL